jgi:hypothetical protein
MQKNYKNTTGLVVNFFITIFVIVVILTVFLLLLYYLTPNNYIIELFDESKYNFVKEFTVNIGPGLNFNVPNSDSDSNFLKFDKINNLDIVTEQTDIPTEQFNNINLLIKNTIKSQSIICNQNELVWTKYGSNIIILNQSENNIGIKVSIYINVK